jgi:hypothetical protein
MAHAGLMEGDLHWLQFQEVDDDLLFHYTRPDTLAGILGSWMLWLGPYAKTNDPREQKEWKAGFLMPAPGGRRPEERFLAFFDNNADRVCQVTDRVLRRGARLACFAVDRPALPDATAGTLFHRGWARARMWQQYADEHRGACLVFNRTELLSAIDDQLPHEDGDLYFFGRVEYRDQALTIRLSVRDLVERGIEETLDDFQTRRGAAMHLYLTKNTDWESEQEFRVVVVRRFVPVGEDLDPIKVDLRGALKTVVLGERYDGDIAAILRGHPEVDVLRCWWGDGVPLLGDGPEGS